MGAALPPVTLLRLNLRGAAADLPAARARLLADLDRANWPATGADEVVLLRSLAVRDTAERLAAQAARQAAVLAQAAVDGWSAQAADAAAVRFDTSTAMAACLLRDLLAGQAGRCWYWQHRQADVLGRPLAAAVAAVLGERPLALPELLAGLGEHAPRAWADLWSALDEAGARQVLGAVAASTGWALVDRPGQAVDSAAPPALHDAPGALQREHRQLAASLVRSQRGSSGDAVPAQAQLAALYLLWRHQPALLGRHGAGAWHLARLADTLWRAPSQDGHGGTNPDAHAVAGDHPPGKKRATDILLEAMQPPAPGRANTVSSAPAEADAQADARAQATTDAGDPGDRQAPDPARQAALSDRLPAWSAPAQTRDPSLAQADDPQAPGAAARSHPTDAAGREVLTGSVDSHDFVTSSGGLFYLLNILKLRGAQDLLARDTVDLGGDAATAHHWSAPGCGWRWLARLGLALAIPLDAPLRRFLASQSGLGDPGALDHLPPLPDEERLLALAQARVGPAVWNAPSTWTRTARVIATRSHVDVHLRSADVTLDLRRTGLDIDPGWLPWLGRVVHLHYDSALTPGHLRP